MPKRTKNYFFFFNDTATTEIYTLSLHDALPICRCDLPHGCRCARARAGGRPRGWCAANRGERIDGHQPRTRDRKSTRLNSSHGYISYAVFCLKKKYKRSRDLLPIAPSILVADQL